MLEKIQGAVDVPGVGFGDGQAVEPVKQGLLFEAAAAALGAYVVAAVARQKDADVHLVGSVFQPAEIAFDAVIRRCAVYDGLLLVQSQILKRPVHGNFVPPTVGNQVFEFHAAL